MPVCSLKEWPYHRGSCVDAAPNHRVLKRGTLRGLIRTAGLTVDEFVDLLRR